MLTVDYDRLELAPDDLVLDLGCGFGRHAFEAFRRGARVVACDLSTDELIQVRATFEAMVEYGEVEPDHGLAAAVQGDATCLPFPDNHFDRIIASEVMEHITDDTAALTELTRILRPGGVLAVTVPSWLPEVICWKLSDEYHAPFVEGGHVRIYTLSELQFRMEAVGLEPIGNHREHGLHAPYWWLKCAVGPTNDDHPLAKAFHKILVWDIADNPLPTRVADKVLSPLIGKSVVQYARKPEVPADPSGADSGAEEVSKPRSDDPAAPRLKENA